MFFYQIHERQIRSDLNLRAIACDRNDDGTLVVYARIYNQGWYLVPAMPLMTGYIDAFRVVATTTNANGGREEIQGTARSLIPVAGTVDVTLTGGHMQASEVTRIAVVADPDYVVPDPLRDNNVLVWQGTMNGDDPKCGVAR